MYLPSDWFFFVVSRKLSKGKCYRIHMPERKRKVEPSVFFMEGLFGFFKTIRNRLAFFKRMNTGFQKRWLGLGGQKTTSVSRDD